MQIHPNLKFWIDTMIEEQASDLILTAARPPMIRVMGDLRPIGDADMVTNDIEQVAFMLMSDAQRKHFEEFFELDASFGIEGVARFRLNVFRQQGNTGLVIRILSAEIPELEPLGVPAIVKDWLMMPHGIIITTGPTGSGKSTSQAAMIRFLNERQPLHVVTIEDPVEYTHRHGTCTIEQREVGTDTHSFSEALKHVLRQTPDVIMIGEMRDMETFESALKLAETGHLVLATLHTGDTTQAITRIIDVFPAEQQQQVRMQLALTLVGVMSQQLVPSIDGKRRFLASEVMHANGAIRNLVQKNDLAQVYSVLQTSSQEGMHTMNQDLLRLYSEGKISLEQARLFTTRQKEFDQLSSRTEAMFNA